jgi:capsular polysaccharide biosynthesis protein
MNNQEKSISLSELFSICWKRLWLLVLVAVIAAGSTYAALSVTYTEQYTSKSTLFVTHPEKGLSASSSTHYYEATINTVADCAELMTSRTVLYNVINTLGLDKEGITYARLKSMISISNVPNTHVIEIAVTCSDPEEAKEIVDVLCSIGAAQIESYIEFATAQVIDEGTLNKHPSNSVSIAVPVAVGFAAALVVLGIFVLMAIMDDKINSAADIESELGLSVLGSIPYFDEKNTGKSTYGGVEEK